MKVARTAGRKAGRGAILVAAVLALLVAGAAWGRAQAVTLLGPVNPAATAPVTFQVQPGNTSAQVAASLAAAGLVKNAAAFRFYLRYRALDGRLQAGEYQLSPALTAAEVAARLGSGRVTQLSFTVPEGMTVRQVADLLSSKGIVDKDRFLAAARDRSLVQDLLPATGAPLAEPLEGYLFPDTYSIPKGYSEKQIVAMMVGQFRRVMTPAWQQQAKNSGLTVHQAVALASIIEREAEVPQDRPLISSVFHNRLKIGMKLDSCATVNYALGKSQLILTYKDLDVNSPYNTYKYAGLPPGPIASPGAASLQAALYPDDSRYLYFVAKGDGSHAFARTLSEHLANARKYEASLQAGSQAADGKAN
ncbi:MAG: endolytic transglycosylase MltG [Symbiobacteriia bacterium]